MLEVKEHGEQGDRLRMDLVNNERQIPGIGMEMILRGLDDLDAGRFRPLKDVMAEIRQ